jgi:hypothetical protein
MVRTFLKVCGAWLLFFVSARAKKEIIIISLSLSGIVEEGWIVEDMCYASETRIRRASEPARKREVFITA